MGPMSGYPVPNVSINACDILNRTPIAVYAVNSYFVQVLTTDINFCIPISPWIRPVFIQYVCFSLDLF